VDRLPAKRLLVVACLLQALVAVALATTTTHAITLICIAALGSCSAFVLPGFSALVPSLVGDKNVGQAQGVLTAALSVAALIGPAFGGLLVAAFGQSGPLYVDAATFALCALGTAALRGNRVPEPGAKKRTRGELSAGARFLRDDLVLRPILIVALAFVLTVDLVAVAQVFLVTRTLHGSALAYGLVSACTGLGTALASLGVRRYVGRLRRDLVFIFGAPP
jgi:MFS family permease